MRPVATSGGTRPGAAHNTPTAGSRSPRQLPGGRHGLDRRFVVEHQRRRILEAMATVCAERGYAEATVDDVVAAAGVSRRALYDLYDNREAVFLDAYERAAGRLVRTVREACAGAADFPQAVHDGLRALLVALAGQPEVARMVVVEVTAAGHAAASLRGKTMAALVELLRRGAARSGRSCGVPALPQLAVGGVHEVVYTCVCADDTAALPALSADLSRSLLLPYLGEDADQAGTPAG